MRKLLTGVCLVLCMLVNSNVSAQTITIIQPNGGEILAPCQNYTIKWTQSGAVSNYWNVDYSIDGGTIWASVATNFLSTNGEYSWSVPNIISNNVLVRVSDAQRSSVADQSDAVFSIVMPIQLSFPNGGEILQGNTVRTITWTDNNPAMRVSIYYSLDNGATWVSIVGFHLAPTNSYAWTVPNIARTTTCRVKVQRFSIDCTKDISDAAFTITPATPVLTYPNGGQLLNVFCSSTITWNTTSIYASAVRLDYSTDNGSNWINIVNGASNTGSYSWTVPNTPSTNSLVRLSNYNDLSIADTSDAIFTISKPVTVTVLNNAETVVGCSTVSIAFSRSNCVGSWRAQYSTDNGANYSTIGTTSTSSINWVVPNGINVSTAKIKVVSVDYPTIFDESDGNFTIIPSNDITVTSANGGEVWQGLSNQTITWTNLPTASGQYNVEFSTNNGSSWSTIASNVTGNSYTWSVANIPSSTCRVRVVDFNNTCKNDISDAVFTITPAVPVLISPNGGQLISVFCTQNITWNTATIYSTVRLDYSTDNGATWTNIVNGASNTGSYSWTIPNAPSANCLVRLANMNNLSLTDVSDAVFTIAKPITVNVLNNAETVVGCSTMSIIFSRSNCVGSWRVQYSTDNGANYASIGTTSGSNISWVVPNGINVSTAKIKVVSVDYPTIFDESDGNFTIIPSNDITVTSANGGEVWQGLSNQTITWTNLPTASGQYNVEFSTNNGSSWSTIASNVTGNSYAWSVPNIPSTTCRVRVVDFNNTCKNDISDAVFTITPAVPVLISPNGGTLISVFCTQNITWNTATIYSTVRLDYSTDNGATWTNIVNGASNTGSYSWTIPNAPSANCLVRLANMNNLALTDVSDAVFTILKPVTVTVLNNAETVVGCSTVSIFFSRSNCVGSWRVQYSTDNGANYATIGTTSGSNISWVVPNGINISTAKIKVVSVDYPTIFDESDGNFTITPSNDITVTSANGGEVWQGLSNQTITWTNLPTASGQYNVEYSTNNGSSWSTIASNVTGNSYTWSVANIPSSTCRVRVVDFNNTCKNDISDAVFTITPAVPVLISPNGGTLISVFCTQNITWNTATIYSTVRLDYSTDNGTTWTNIVNGASNTGSYSWTIPNAPSANCLVRLANMNNLSLTDVSDAVFTILKPVTVNVLNNAETVVGCSTVSIAFNRSNCVGSWRVQYSTDNGANYTTIGTTSTSSINWVVPNGINVSTAKIKVVSVDYPTIFDESDGNFTIIPSNDITVTSANGGEVWQGLSNQTITWTNLPTASGQYNVEYSTNNGSSWSTIASNVTGNSYTWSVANIPSSTCRVRVVDFNNTCKNDISDAVFTITPAVPVLISPNGGTLISVFCTQNITWNTATIYSTVRLDYSTDNGATWTNIVNGASNTGSYSWTIPNAPSANCLVRLANMNNLALTDVSDAVFTIAKPITVNVLNNAETIVGCSTMSIIFSRSNCVGSWRVQYSTDNGANYATIGTTSGSNISWVVPNGINVSTAKIKVVSVDYPTIFDESDGNFTIIPSNDITVTSANGGEVWQGLSTKIITWTNLPAASGFYNLDLSIDNGVSWINIATNLTGNAYNWVVPNLFYNSCRLRVSDYINTCKNDISDAVFSIVPATPILTAPNGGQSWYTGTSNLITWDRTKIFTATVRLDYSTNNGASWNLITSSTDNNGSYSWTVAYANSNTCLVRVSNYNLTSISDVSDSVFTIKPAVTILTPNGNSQVNVGGCTATSITFEHSPAYSTFSIDYTINDGLSYETIISSFSAPASPATYNWSIPNVSTTLARVRVRPVNTTYYDNSDETFSIIKAVTIVQPNFGGIMQSGTNYDIKWSSDGISSIYNLYYTIDGGASYIPIVTGYNTSDSKYTWTVPNTVSSSCRIMIRDNINTCKTDTSDLAFIISSNPAPIKLVSPNGVGDTLNSCNNYTIAWTDTSASGTYNIAYSLNSGQTWINIVSNYTTSAHNYSWAVPANISSNAVLLRVNYSANQSIYDWSDAFFSITQPTYTFTGTGNWSNAANWANNTPPPATLPACGMIVINPQANGECVVDMPYTISPGGTFIVKAGKKLTVPGNLIIQ